MRIKSKALKPRALRRTKGDIIFNTLVYALFALCALLVLYPLWIVIIASVSDPIQVILGKVMLFPKGFSLVGYQKLLNAPIVWRSLANSVFYTGAGTVLNLFLTMMCGYALTRPFRGRKFVNVFLIFVMFFSGGLIPTFITVKNLGLYNTPFIMVIMGAVNVFNVMIARTFIKGTIPEELHEAVVIDGGTDFSYFFRIVLPLSKACIGVLAVYYAVGHWNDYYTGLIYIQSRNLYPFQNILREMLTVLSSNSSSDFTANITDAAQAARVALAVKYCAVVITTVPVLILYLFLQKYFVKGVMIGSLKG